MRWLTQLKMQLQMLFRRRAGQNLDRELAFHLDRQIEENIAAGQSPEEARRAALCTFGNPGLVRETTRSTWRWTTLELLLRDLRFSLRALRRTPGFTAIAILVMALGIGANVALFAVVRSVLLNPLPYRDPQQLVALYSHNNPTDANPWAPIDAGSFFAWQKASQGRAEMALISPFQGNNVSAEGGQLPEKATTAWISSNFFSVLGVQPILGRTFSPAEDSPKAEATAILSYTFWKRRYSGDPNVIGRKIWLDARPYTIVGVMPQSLTFLGPFSSGKIQLWTPVSHEAPPWLMSTLEDHEFVGIARLAPGTTLPQLLSLLTTVQQHLKAENPNAGVRKLASGRFLLDDAVQEYKTPLYVLFAATGCVLLIACLNVASLLVARTAARRKDLAIRSALGGGRLRLIREQLLESFTLTTAGGLVGLGIAALALRWLQHARPDMRRIEGIHLDLTALAFTAAAILLCTLFSGLISTFSVDSRRILTALNESSRSQSGGRARAGLRRSLLMLEVGFTVVLLIGAGLLLKSYSQLRSTDMGIPTANLLSMHIGLPDVRYKTEEQHVAFWENLIARVRALPGVASAGLTSSTPGQGWDGDRLVSVVEHPPLPVGEGIDTLVRAVDPGYFDAIGLRILSGRTFSAGERLKNDHVILISQEAVRVAFPGGEDPIGKHLQTSFGGDIYRIIGVVGNTRYLVSKPILPMMYMPAYGNGFTNLNLVVRSAHDVDSLALPIQKLLSQLDPDLPVSNVETLEETLAKSTLSSQFDSLLILGFAVIALILAAAGLYGVLAYLVTQRTNELGIRIALGAQRPELLRLVLFDGLQPALIGLLVGLAGSAAAVKLLRSMLYGTHPYDPAIFLAVTGLLLAVAAIACALPAWRASRLNPVEALRVE